MENYSPYLEMLGLSHLHWPSSSHNVTVYLKIKKNITLIFGLVSKSCKIIFIDKLLGSDNVKLDVMSTLVELK